MITIKTGTGAPQVVKNSGMALTQVLLIIALISVFIVSITYSVRNYIRSAEQIQYRTEAKLTLRTMQTRVLEAMLTEPWVTSEQNITNPIAQNWNFYGRWFRVDNVDIRITNVSSLMLLSVNDEDYYQRYLKSLDVDTVQAKQAAKAMVDYQGGELGRPIQSLHELRFITGLGETVVEKLQQYATPFVVSNRSPMYMPDQLLTAEMDASAAQRVKALRSDGTFDRNNFELATGIEPDMMVIHYPGPIFRIELLYQQNDISQNEQITVELRPYDQPPVTFLSTGLTGNGKTARPSEQ
ncbi:hypothetical protein LG288_02535 [Idiomarina seosinensis]|uniref:hypothetical protein n=1 Tax=Idiomarina seosinensis TaxID=281739 RepID=UPI00384C75F6